MEIRVETITPKIAQEWLDRSHDVTQRSLSKRRVNRFVHAMLEGQWQLTHQALALDDKERVIDGQHRLAAVIQAGQTKPDITLDMWVAHGADPASFDVVDTGAARTTADALKIAGYTNTNVLAAAVRTTLVYEQTKGTTQEWPRTAGTLTSVDVVEFLDVTRQRERAVAALQIGARVSGAVGRQGLVSTLTAAALICMQRVDDEVPTGLGPDSMHEFFERLADGAMLSSTSPILALRRWMIGDTGFSKVPHTYRRPVGVAVTLKAINDYLLGRERSIVIYRVGVEAMPLVVTRAELEASRVAEESALAASEAAEASADAARAKTGRTTRSRRKADA